MEQVESKSANAGYKVTIIILLLIIALLIWLLLSVKNHSFRVINEKDIKTQVLTEELNSMMAEHDSIKVEYAQLADKISRQDSIIKTQESEIRKLIASQVDYKRVKKKLEYLRNITQGYVHQIDSLVRVNQDLKDENLKITNKYHKSQEANVELQKVKEQLSEKVNMASVLKASNISITAYKNKGGNKEKATDKASKTDKIRICFTILENPVATPGIRSIYLRVARPDKMIIGEKEDTYTFDLNGQKLQYTLKKDINYDNKAQSLCLDWIHKDTSHEPMKGTYEVMIYADNNLIGNGQFALK